MVCKKTNLYRSNENAAMVTKELRTEEK